MHCGCFFLILAVALGRYVTGFGRTPRHRSIMISTNNYRASMRDFVVRLHSSGSSSSSSNVPSEATEDSLMTMVGVPQLETLQKLLSYCGAPGSTGCTLGEGDMIRTTPAFREELHPYLRPISQSQSTGNYICAYKRVGSSEDDICPIVESGLNLPGMKLLALNSEHLLRRIVCEADEKNHPLFSDILSLYNANQKDSPYERGSVTKLGYGLDKYLLLRVGPFPDLYETISFQHWARGDESSALIAAETSNGKFPGFGCTYASYARLLSQLPNRIEEARDAARVCLRLPISTVGITLEEFRQVAILAGVALDTDDIGVAMHKLERIYDQLNTTEEQQQHGQRSSRNYDSMPTQEQLAIHDAAKLLNKVAMSGGQWGPIRRELASIYEKAGWVTMAEFVNPTLGDKR